MRSQSCPQREGSGALRCGWAPIPRWLQREEVSSSSGGPFLPLPADESADDHGQAVLSPRATMPSPHTDRKKRVSALENDLMAAFLDAKRSGFVTEVERESPLVLLARAGGSPLQSGSSCSSGSIPFAATPPLDDVSPAGRQPSNTSEGSGEDRLGGADTLNGSDRFRVAKSPGDEDLRAHARRKRERDNLLGPKHEAGRIPSPEDEGSTCSNGLPSALLCGGHSCYSLFSPCTPKERRGIGGSSGNRDRIAHPRKHALALRHFP